MTQQQFKKINLDDVQTQPAEECGIYGAGFSNLSLFFGSEKLGFNISEIAPGKYLCPYHFHHLEEELLLVLEGEATVRQNDEAHIIKKNDLVFYNLKVPHQLYNHTAHICRILAISNTDPNDICEYPDSHKINFRRLRKIYLEGQEVEYFEGEEREARFWRVMHR